MSVIWAECALPTRAGELGLASTGTEPVYLRKRPARTGSWLLAACLVAVVGVAFRVPSAGEDPAWAEQVRPPVKLTKQYPLGERRLCCRRASGLPSAALAANGAARAQVQGSASPWPFVAGGVAAVLAALSCGWLLGRRRPRGSPRHPEATAMELVPVEVDDAHAEPAFAVPAPAAPVTPVPHVGSTAPAVSVLGYACRRPDRDGASNLELQSQLIAIERYCHRHGWTLLKVVRDVETSTGKTLARPGLAYALNRIADGQASCLMVSKLERLTRSVIELAALFEWFNGAEARLVVLDQRIDTFTPSGRLTAETIVSLGTWERDKLSARTRRGRSSAPWTSRPAVGQNPELKDWIVSMREGGMTLQAIADALNREGVPTLRGGVEWRPSSVQSALGYQRPRRSGESVLPPTRSKNRGRDC
jgi:DNA invertase Pin-like site-specific DNA recombinase